MRLEKKLKKKIKKKEIERQRKVWKVHVQNRDIERVKTTGRERVSRMQSVGILESSEPYNE